MTRTAIAIQPEPKGMADAVLCSRPAVKSDHCLVLWGDQILLRKETIAACVSLHEQRTDARLTFPTVEREQARTSVLIGIQKAALPEFTKRGKKPFRFHSGENDCGLFLFQTQALFDILNKNQDDPRYRGKRTSEYNLLPLIPLLDQSDGDVATLKIEDDAESIGINTQEEGRMVEALLKQRLGHSIP